MPSVSYQMMALQFWRGCRWVTRESQQSQEIHLELISAFNCALISAEGERYELTSTQESAQKIATSSTAFRVLDIALKDISFVESLPTRMSDGFFAFTLWTPGGVLGNQKTLCFSNESARMQWIDVIQAARNPGGSISPSPAASPAIKPLTNATPGHSGLSHVSVRSRHEAAQWLQDVVKGSRMGAIAALRSDVEAMQEGHTRGVAESLLDRLAAEKDIGVHYKVDRDEAQSTHQTYYDDCTLVIDMEQHTRVGGGGGEPSLGSSAKPPQLPRPYSNSREMLTLSKLAQIGQP